MKIVTIFLLLIFTSGAALAWEPPIGIPAPDFGIGESHNLYAGMAGYEDAGNGPYTHYIDNTAVCTDTDNPNGTAENPRCSMPTTLAAGSVAEIHGGPYGGRDTTWNLNGTQSQPVFVRGIGPNNKALFSGSSSRVIAISGSYAVVEYIEVTNDSAVEITSSDHVALRHSHIHDHQGKGNIVGINGGSSYIVIYGNEVNNNGQIPSTKDHHGVYTFANTDHIWIVDNHIHHNSGDGIQFCHNCVDRGNGPSNIFIGRNHIHDDEENALDFKEFIGPVIVSQNVMHGYLSSPNSNGDAVRVNDEGSQGEIWILFNTIFDSRLGIEPSRSDADVYIIGNVIFDIGSAAVGQDADYVINNTIYDVPTAIGAGEARSNIVFNATTALGGDVGSCSHNLVQSGSVENGCTNTINADPEVIIGAQGNVIGLQETSPAIGAGYGDHAVFALFQSQYGINIRFDANGMPRPVGQPWSIGAHEVLDSVPPMPPGDLTVTP